MANLPECEFVYLITKDTEWVVTAIPDCHPYTPEHVAKEVTRREKNSDSGGVKVWKARLVDVQEMELVPERIIPVSLKKKDPLTT